MTDPNFFNQILIWPFINVLMGLYNLISSLGIPGALGFAIIGITLLIRGALHPLTAKQMESAEKMNALKPELDELKEEYKDDKQKLQQEQIKLYQKHGINPAAGCLPLLLQFPILIALYRMFIELLADRSPEETVELVNQIAYNSWFQIESLDLNFFGINLGLRPNQWQEFGFWLLAIPLITAGLQWYQTKKMMPQPPAPTKKKGKKKGGKPEENFAQELQKQMSIMMPIMIGFFAYSFPVGLSLYWNTFTVFALYSRRKKK